MVGATPLAGVLACGGFCGAFAIHQRETQGRPAAAAAEGEASRRPGVCGEVLNWVLGPCFALLLAGLLWMSLRQPAGSSGAWHVCAG